MIALDAMGGDFAPNVTVLGAIKVAKKGIPVGLFGDQAMLLPLLNRLESGWKNLPISLIHCSQMIEMDEEPTKSILKKKDASLVRATQAVADGHACAVVSAGNSGAALVAGTLILGRAEGILRPALGNFLPTMNGSIFCIDLGANTECKPEYLEQFALLGHVYVQKVKGIRKPRIALLSNGEEAYKGPQLVKQVYERLECNAALNFIGNLQSRDIFDDHADVLVCDGFSGNILLKAVEGTSTAMSQWIRQEVSRSLFYKLIFALGCGVFRKLKKRVDYARAGGALLLGLRHPLIVAHGCSNVLAVEHALLFAHKCAQEKFIPSFNEEFFSLLCGTQQYDVRRTQNYEILRKR